MAGKVSAGGTATITVTGYLGRDPEMAYNPDGSPFTSISVASNYYDRSSKTTKPMWFKAVVFGKRAEAVAQWLSKGCAVCVTGKFLAREYTTKDGRSGTSLEITNAEVEFITMKPSATEPSQGPVEIGDGGPDW